MYGCFLDIHKVTMNYVLFFTLMTLVLSSISAVNVIGLIIQLDVLIYTFNTFYVIFAFYVECNFF